MIPAQISTDWAFDRYESVRDRLPAAQYPSASAQAASLSDVADFYDAFVLDAFGVLNRGDAPIPGAVDRMAELRARGKRLIVLTNAASYTRTQLLAKYHRLGFDFTADEVVSSRDVALSWLPLLENDRPWAAVSLPSDDLTDSPFPIVPLQDDTSLYERAGGFVLLTSQNWRPAQHGRLLDALRQEPRPLVVANPDLVAPRETNLSIEPGAIAHDIADQLDLTPSFFGKPYDRAFDVAVMRLDGIPRSRIAMVGDTLHTDILGGAAAGLGTVLITDHGLFAGRKVEPYIDRSGIFPNWIVKTT